MTQNRDKGRCTECSSTCGELVRCPCGETLCPACFDRAHQEHWEMQKQNPAVGGVLADDTNHNQANRKEHAMRRVTFIHSIRYDHRGRRLYQIWCPVHKGHGWVPVRPFPGVICRNCREALRNSGTSVVVVRHGRRRSRVISLA